VGIRQLPCGNYQAPSWSMHPPHTHVSGPRGRRALVGPVPLGGAPVRHRAEDPVGDIVEHWLVGVEPDWPDQAAWWRRAWEADIAPRRPRFDVDEVTPWAIEHALSVSPT